MTPPNHGNRWTKTARASFKVDWLNPDMTREEVAAKYDRTFTACCTMAAEMGLRRVVRRKAENPHRSGPTPTEGAEKQEAERQAEKIRAYWANQKRPVTVEVVWVPGSAHHHGCWSPRIVDAVRVG